MKRKTIKQLTQTAIKNMDEVIDIIHDLLHADRPEPGVFEWARVKHLKSAKLLKTAYFSTRRKNQLEELQEPGLPDLLSEFMTQCKQLDVLLKMFGEKLEYMIDDTILDSELIG